MFGYYDCEKKQYILRESFKKGLVGAIKEYLDEIDGNIDSLDAYQIEGELKSVIYFLCRDNSEVLLDSILSNVDECLS